MRSTGYYQGTQGQVAFFYISDTEEIQKLEDMKEKQLVIQAEPLRGKRSLNANSYFWSLLDKMAKRIGSDKDTMYHLELSRYGVFTDMEVVPEALATLRRFFRHIERLHDGYEDGEMVKVRCYYGSSHYNTKEMSDLIDGTIRDAKDLGIDTATEEEIRAMIAAWKGGGA